MKIVFVGFIIKKMTRIVNTAKSHFQLKVRENDYVSLNDTTSFSKNKKLISV